jgi:Dynamin family
MEDLDQRRQELVAGLDRSVSWLGTLDVLRTMDAPPAQLVPATTLSAARLEVLRKRAAASVLTVAMMGQFSSGKSFLLSGLQGRLTYERMREAGSRRHRYVGLLPSSPKPTTATPARIVPINSRHTDIGDPAATHGESELFVKFVGGTSWEARGKIVNPMSVAAYAAELPEWVENRHDGDRARQVAEIEITIESAPLPMQLYDLPGHSSPNRVHERIIEERLQDADCFIYVTKATSTLAEPELEMMRTIYAHHKATRKPVIWVVTAIEIAAAEGLDDEPAWKTTVRENNRYLREYFTLADGQPDEAFIGEGFIGVSPALEAQGRSYAETEPERADEDIAESNMHGLRDRLRRVAGSGAAERHLDALAKEAAAAITAEVSSVRALHAVEQIPFEEVDSKRAEVSQQVSHLSQVHDDVRRSTLDGLHHALARLTPRFNGPAGLRTVLHNALDQKITTANLLNTKATHTLELDTLNEARTWLSSQDGPILEWEAAYQEAARQARNELESLFADIGILGGLEQAAEIDADDLTIGARRPTTGPGSDPLAMTLDLASKLSPIVGSALAVAGFATSTIALPPIGAGLVLAGLYGWMRDRDKRSTVLGILRDEEIRNLDEVARRVEAWFHDQARASIDSLVAAIDAAAARERYTLTSSLRRLEQRTQERDFVQRRAFLDGLEKARHEGDDLIAFFAAAR